MKKPFALLSLLLLLMISCKNTTADASVEEATAKKINPIAEFTGNNPDNDQPSQSKGKVSKGSLVNGKLFPFAGNNFRYFDTTSYLRRKAYTHERVRAATLAAYKDLEKAVPGRRFVIMECSHRDGGKIFPHRTHQNGLSIDFMMPLKKNDQPYYRLDSLGRSHYFLEFLDDGRFKKDTSISVDFDLVAQHILLLEKNARKHGLKINKVIIKIEMKKYLYATAHGKKLKQSGIYLVQSLDHLANVSHDEHYHIDFDLLR